MSVRGSAGNLAQAAKTLSAEWERTREHWRDARGQDFQKTFLDPLPGHVSRAILAIQEIEALLEKVRRDCE